MINFNSDDLITGYIKELLHEFNLPKCRINPPADTHYDGEVYISGSRFMRWESGAEKVLGQYVYGKPYLNITKNLEINSSIYDTYTHKYLGNYLRFLRDYKGIDLMSMYNCYANETCSSLDLDLGKDRVFSTKNNDYKIYMVPVKFGRKYTVAIDCSSTIEMVTGIYANSHLISSLNVTYAKASGVRFKHPIVYDKLLTRINDSNVLRQYFSQEANSNLYLFVKVPSSNESSFTVLEGDYTANTQLVFSEGVLKQNRSVCNYESGENFEKAMKSRPIISRLQLLEVNGKVSHPFSERLVEYLLDNVITPLDKFSENIVRIQNRLIERYKEEKIGRQYLDGHSGMWDDVMRNVVYDIALSSGLESNPRNNKFDVLGYVDKDAEQEIGE